MAMGSVMLLKAQESVKTFTDFEALSEEILICSQENSTDDQEWNVSNKKYEEKFKKYNSAQEHEIASWNVRKQHKKKNEIVQRPDVLQNYDSTSFSPGFTATVTSTYFRCIIE